jgi:hypothetical protein
MSRERGHHAVIVGCNKLQLGGRHLQRSVINSRRVDGEHHAVVTLNHGAHRRRAEDQAERPVERSRLAAAQQMAEHDRARFLAGQFPQLTGHNLAHATKPFNVPGICGFFQSHPAADRLGAFGHHDDRVLVAMAHCPAFDVRGD